MNGIILAGINSNTGKTLIASGLMKSLSKNHDVVAYKVGPDFIDPKYHSFVLDKPSYNLDYPICGDNIDYLFYNQLNDNSFAVVEGVMGLFDGQRAKDLSENGSTFFVAKRFGLPIILIVDLSDDAVLETTEALNKAEAEGYRISGIILNKVKNDEDVEKFKKELDGKADILGVVKYNPDYILEEKRLGLKMPDEIDNLDDKLKALSRELEASIDFDKLLSLSQIQDKKEIESPFSDYENEFTDLTIGIARDPAFNFYYEDNLELLKKLGVNLKFFSTLADKHLPDDIDAIYIGGGYPENYLDELENNFHLRVDIYNALHDGMSCLAEGGGLLYLLDQVSNGDTSAQLLCFFNVRSKMAEKLVHFGYNTLEPVEPFQGNIKINAHEFHYSETTEFEMLPHIFKVSNPDDVWLDGLYRKNTLAFFPHIHFYAQPNGKEFLIQYLESLRKDESNN